MEVEHCIRGDGEEIRNFVHRIKRTVDKGWPDDLNGIEVAQYAAERTAQGRQRRQRYIDYSLKGLRPRYLQRKAQENLMENPNATWNDFSTRVIQRDVSFQVSSTFLNDEEQTKVKMATLGQEMKNLRLKLQEHRVNAVEGNSRTADLTINLRLALRPMNLKFQQNNNQTSSNVVRFTTTDDTIFELSDLYPLNY